MTRLSSFRTAVAQLRALRAGTGNGAAYIRSLNECQRAWGLLTMDHTGSSRMTPTDRATWSRILDGIWRWAE